MGNTWRLTHLAQRKHNSISVFYQGRHHLQPSRRPRRSHCQFPRWSPREGDLGHHNAAVGQRVEHPPFASFRVFQSSGPGCRSRLAPQEDHAVRDGFDGVDCEQHQVFAGCRFDRDGAFCVSLAAWLVLVDADQLS
jgi:hypothetical protein